MGTRTRSVGGSIMGIGDQLLATGLARGAFARGKRIALGDGRRIYWDHNSPLIFRGNPNLAPPNTDLRARDLEWINYRKGHRIYNTHDPAHARWVWNMDFRAVPGEVFFDDVERVEASHHGQGFVVLEPHVPSKSYAQNKQWGVKRYEAVARELSSAGLDVVRFTYPTQRAERIEHVRPILTPTFRHAMAVLARAKLYLGAEGGLHHAAAALGVPAVVLFGGFIPPQVTGYDTHINLTGGATACGSLMPCQHCRDAMAAISIDEVAAAAYRAIG